MINTIKKNKKQGSKNKIKSKIKNNKKYKKQNKTHIKRKSNLINTKKNIFDFQGGDGERKYKSITGEVMKLVYIEKPAFIFRDLKNFFKTQSPNYFIKHYPAEWEIVKKMWFFNKNKSLIKNGLDSLEKGVYYLNYVYHYQAKVRGILYDLKNLIEKRVRLIFDTIVTEDELLFEKSKKTKDEKYKKSVSPSSLKSTFNSELNSELKGGSSFELNPYNVILYYGTSQGISGPSNSDLEGLKDQTDSLGLFEKLVQKFKKFSKKLFYSFNPKNVFKGSILRYETDKLYYKISYKYKLLKQSLKHLASSQHKLYIYYLNSIYFNDVILKYIKISDDDSKELESFDEKKAKKYQQIIKLKPVFNGINKYTNDFKHDYKEIVKMYEQSINGFWIQDDNGRIIFNFYKSNDEITSEKKIKQIMKDIKIDKYLDQIASNIMGQIYIKISKKNLEFANKTQPKQTFLEVRTIAQERFCYSRIMVQYFIWNMLLKSQGFDINISQMLKDPSDPMAITIHKDVHNPLKAEYNTSLITKMLLADSNLKISNSGNRIEWENTLDGLKSYSSFATIFGYYDNNLINMGIPKHLILQEIDKSKDVISSSLIDDIRKMMPKNMRGGDIENDKKLLQRYTSELTQLKEQLTKMSTKNPLYTLTESRYKALEPKVSQLRRMISRGNNTYKPVQVMKLSNVRNNQVIPDRQTIIINNEELKDGKLVTNTMEENMGWFDIWRRNFLQNFRVMCRLIDSYSNYTFDRGNEKIQPDVYYLFYRDEILKQFVRAFTGCGMLDTLYRIFRHHITEKTSFTNKGKLNNPATNFKNKLPYICMSSQISYTYTLLFNADYNVNLLDEYFQVRLAIANDYIDHIFNKYDDLTPDDSYKIILKNYQYYIELIEKHKKSFVHFNANLKDDTSKDNLHKYGEYFGTSANILYDSFNLETNIFTDKYNINTIINNGKEHLLYNKTPKHNTLDNNNDDNSYSMSSLLSSMDTMSP
jgi:hypothetical protein